MLDSNDLQVVKQIVNEVVYRERDPMYPITLHQLRIFASQQRVELEELVNELDEKGYVVHCTKAKLSPFFYLSESPRNII